MFLTFLVLATLATAPSGTSSPSVEVCRFGQVVPFATASCIVTLHNPSVEALHVSGVKSLGTDVESVKVTDLVVQGHADGVLKLSLTVGNELGSFGYPLELQTDDPEHALLRLMSHGFAISPLDQEHIRVDFGVVDQGKASASRTVHFSSATQPDFRLGKVIDAPDWLQVDNIQQGHGLRLSVGEDAPLGLINGWLKVELHASTQPQLWVRVAADVHGDVVPGSNPYNMGLMRRGEDNSFLIRLTSISGKPFKLGELSLSKTIHAKLGREPCTPPKPGCKLIRVTMEDTQPTGMVKGRLWVELPDRAQRLPINLGGLFLYEDTKIGHIGGGATKDGQSAAVSTSGALDFDSALQALTEPKPPKTLPPPPGEGPLLHWKIKNGKSVYGFQVFRGATKDGRYKLQTSPPIRTRGDTNKAMPYQWRDTTAKPGQTYWYYVRAINDDGSKTKLIEPQKVVVDPRETSLRRQQQGQP